MKRVIAAVLIALVFSGCARVHTVDLSSESAVRDLNVAISGKTVRLRMAGGHEIEASEVNVARQTTTFVYGMSDKLSKEVPTSAIRSMVASQKWGVVAGAAGGLLCGVAIGAASAVGYEDPAGFFSASDMAGIRAIFGGLLGLVGGALLGANIGVEHEYELVEGQ